MFTAVATPEDDNERLSITIVIPMEDEIIHSDKQPFCNDPTCPCHSQALPMPYSTADREARNGR